MKGYGARFEQLSGWRVETRSHPLVGLENGGAAGGRAAQNVPLPVAMPRAMESEVGVQRQAVVEVDQQVLPLRVDLEHGRSDHPLKLSPSRSALCCGDPFADKQWPKNCRDTRQRVALRHRALRSGA